MTRREKDKKKYSKKAKRGKTAKTVKKHSIKKFKKEVCSPKTKEDELGFTCYTSNALKSLKNAWNKRHPTSKIYEETPREIWEKLKHFMRYTCAKESCWLKHECLKKDIDKSLIKELFAPSAPVEWKKNPREWLNTLDIHNVLRQWEKKYKSFRFLGASPIDYDEELSEGECVWEDLCKFQLKEELKDGIKKIGVIFNLDKHTDDGSHWVAVFIDTTKKDIYFFDSYGDRAPSRIYKFCKDVKEQAKKLGEKYKIKQCTKQHQYNNGECGMYCLYFIINLLTGGDFKTFNTVKIPDTKMFELRKKYFNL
jgi:hypothetical protein